MAYHHTTLRSKKNSLSLDELHLKPEVRSKINQLLEEYTYREALHALDIPIDNKILLHGHTGCGKTATANALALALGKKLFTINLSGLVSSKLGETAKNLADIFREATIDQGIIFIDEFDFIGKLRDYDEKDSGEMKRLVNALIQQIDQLSENTILIAATNHIHIIDTALLRRFQIKLDYELPSQEALDAYYDSLLLKFPKDLGAVARHYGISYAEAKDLTYQQIKANVIGLEKRKSHKLFLPFGNSSVQNKHNAVVTTSAIGYELRPLSPNSDIYGLAASANQEALVDGHIVELNGEELHKNDMMQPLGHKRIKINTNLEPEVWAYILDN